MADLRKISQPLSRRAGGCVGAAWHTAVRNMRRYRRRVARIHEANLSGRGAMRLMITLIAALAAPKANFANATGVGTAASPEVACERLMQKVPKKLSEARKLEPLQKEVTKPDLDYCHDNFDRCDLRTLVFKGFSLRLLHEKSSGRVSFHIAEFSSLRKVRQFCGKDCVSDALYNKEKKKYVVDCQEGI